MHGISFLRTLTYPFTLPTHRKTMENPSVMDIKTIIYQPAKSQQRTRPSRQYTLVTHPSWTSLKTKTEMSCDTNTGPHLKESDGLGLRGAVQEPPLCESTNTSKDHGCKSLLKTWSEISSFHGWKFPVQAQPLSTRIRMDCFHEKWFSKFGDFQRTIWRRPKKWHLAQCCINIFSIAHQNPHSWAKKSRVAGG